MIAASAWHVLTRRVSLPSDSYHYIAGNVLSDSVDGSADSNRFVTPTLEAVYLLVVVSPHRQCAPYRGL
jgi:hypothetical protein